MVIRRVVLVVGAAAALACGGDDDGGQGPGPNEPEGDVIVRNDNFAPAALQVEAGATVVWVWSSGGTVHNVTFDNDDVTSGSQGSGTFDRTFAEPGAYPYH
ncbi:MAG: plastocyanin/azurin family copper-binding protein, partial [Gemmatimonadales bacterium]